MVIPTGNVHLECKVGNRCIKICETPVNIKDFSRVAIGGRNEDNSYTFIYLLSTNPLFIIWAHLPSWEKLPPCLFQYRSHQNRTQLKQEPSAPMQLPGPPLASQTVGRSTAVAMAANCLDRCQEFSDSRSRRWVGLPEENHPLSPLPQFSFIALITILNNYLYNYKFNVPPITPMLNRRQSLCHLNT